MTCAACGADNASHARFCGQCGAPQEEPVDLGHVGIVSPRVVWSVIVLIGLSLVALGALASWLLQPEPEVTGPAPIHASVLVEIDPLPSGVDVPLDPLPSELEAPAPEDALTGSTPEPAAPAPRGMGTRATPRAPTKSREPTPRAPTPSEPTPSEPTPSEPTPSEPTIPPPYVAGEPLEPASDPALYMASARRHLASTYGDRVQDCFDGGDTRHPGYSGRIGVAFVLFPDGRVASSRVTQNTTGDPLIGTCLVDAARAWQLPPPPRRTLELSMSFSR